MPCNCKICSGSLYSNTPLESLLLLREDIKAIIESLEKKKPSQVSCHLNHYNNVLKLVRDAISYKAYEADWKHFVD